MANTYYDSPLTATEIESALEAVDGLIVPANNGKVIAVENGTLVAKSVTEYTDFDLQAKTVTPGASQQVVTPDSGYDGLSSVTINGDVDLIPGNIKKDINIFGITGTYEGSGGGGGVPVLYSPIAYYGNSAGSTDSVYSCAVQGSVGDWVLLIVMHRDAITLSNANWELLDSTKADNFNQWISVYRKQLQSANETVTINNPTSARSCACSFLFRNKPNISSPTQQAMDSSSNTYKVTVQRSVNVRLVVFNFPWAGEIGWDSSKPEIALPSYWFTSINTFRMMAYISQDASDVSIYCNLVTSQDAQNNNRVFLYDFETSDSSP